MRISDWSSDVCSSDLALPQLPPRRPQVDPWPPAGPVLLAATGQGERRDHHGREEEGAGVEVEGQALLRAAHDAEQLEVADRVGEPGEEREQAGGDRAGGVGGEGKGAGWGEGVSRGGGL